MSRQFPQRPVRLPDDEWQWLIDFAAAENLPVAKALRIAIAETTGHPERAAAVRATRDEETGKNLTIAAAAVGREKARSDAAEEAERKREARNAKRRAAGR